MKSLLILGLVFTFSTADYISKKSLACTSMQAIKQAPRSEGESGLDITLYAIAHDCVIISKKDKITVVDYELGSKALFQSIIYKKTGQKLYIMRNNLVIEQAGKNNIFKF
ncbi:MAG: hypothetical protein ACI9TV_001570 [Sulfurimonas sp.]|jgi:hypothetical protein|uniref:hypothetical protein n=1 Tax=Sulfurimonas sp. TaxID=2022749 RepID=UPI0039E6C9B6